MEPTVLINLCYLQVLVNQTLSEKITEQPSEMQRKELSWIQTTWINNDNITNVTEWKWSN